MNTKTWFCDVEGCGASVVSAFDYADGPTRGTGSLPEGWKFGHTYDQEGALTRTGHVCPTHAAVLDAIEKAGREAAQPLYQAARDESARVIFEGLRAAGIRFVDRWKKAGV